MRETLKAEEKKTRDKQKFKEESDIQEQKHT